MTTKRTATGKRVKPVPADMRGASAPLVLEKSAGAVVFYCGTALEYVLIRATYWEFPKGQVEPDESESEAALREVREETGLEVRLVTGFREEMSYFYRRGSNLIKKQVVYFLGEATNQNAQVSWEHREAKWLPYEAALAELKYENARGVLRKAHGFLMDRGGMMEDK